MVWTLATGTIMRSVKQAILELMKHRNDHRKFQVMKSLLPNPSQVDVVMKSLARVFVLSSILLHFSSLLYSFEK